MHLHVLRERATQGPTTVRRRLGVLRECLGICQSSVWPCVALVRFFSFCVFRGAGISRERARTVWRICVSHFPARGDLPRPPPCVVGRGFLNWHAALWWGRIWLKPKQSQALCLPWSESAQKALPSSARRRRRHARIMFPDSVGHNDGLGADKAKSPQACLSIAPHN